MSASDETAAAPASEIVKEEQEEKKEAADEVTAEAGAAAEVTAVKKEGEEAAAEETPTPEGACTVCKTDKSRVWRRDKDSKARVCNKCYLDKYPRPPPKPEDAITGHVEATKDVKSDSVMAVKTEQSIKDVKSKSSVAVKTEQSIKEPDGDRDKNGFRNASPEDHVEVEPLLVRFMDWLEKNHNKAESTAKNYKIKVLKSFRTNNLAIADMATEKYRMHFQDQGDSVQHTALNQFSRFYNGQVPVGRNDSVAQRWGTSSTGSVIPQVVIPPSQDIKTERKVMPLLMKEEVKLKSPPKLEMKQEEPPAKVRKLEDDTMSDTEYPEVDLQTFPAKIRIEASGLDKIDGTYARMPTAHRGRAAYALQDGKKEMFMYWRKNNWMISLALGNSKSLGKVQDKECCRHPCEPYPNIWSVYHKDGGDFFLAHCLRVIDAEAHKTAAVEPLPKEPDMAGVVGASPHRAKRHKAEKDPEKAIAKAEKKAEKKAEVKAEKEAEKEAAKTDEAAMPSSPGGADVASPKLTPKAASSSSEESDSDSDSDSSSSESGASSGAGDAPKTSPAAPALPPAKGAYDQTKAKVFEAKIRQMLKITKNPEEADKKLGMFVVQRKNYMQMSTLSEEQLMQLKDKLVLEFVTNAPKAAPAPAAPAPDASAPQGLPEGPSGMPSAPQGTELPVTPPDNGPQPSEDLGNHRLNIQPAKSILKNWDRVGGRMFPSSRGQKRIWMGDPVRGPPINKVPVHNYREYLDKLWFVSPGAVVSCDTCSMEVSQSMGCLQGAPGRSQFAQLTFLCTNCMSG